MTECITLLSTKEICSIFSLNIWCHRMEWVNVLGRNKNWNEKKEEQAICMRVCEDLSIIHSYIMRATFLRCICAYTYQRGFLAVNNYALEWVSALSHSQNFSSLPLFLLEGRNPNLFDWSEENKVTEIKTWVSDDISCMFANLVSSIIFLKKYLF